MNHLDLFTGIGGFSLAADWVWGTDHHIHAFVESDLFCAFVLKKHWPDVPIWKYIEGYKHDGTAIDLITAGWPCQPVSIAGKRTGAEDDRWLWHKAFEIIQEVQPRWFLGENVTGIISMELDQVLSDLESAEYTTWPFIIPAAAVDAPHKRERVWVLSYSAEVGHEQIQKARVYVQRGAGQQPAGCASTNLVYQPVEGWRYEGNEESKGQAEEKISGCGSEREEPSIWEPEPQLARLVHGVSTDVHRIRAQGNAVVPQVPAILMHAIKRTEEWIK